MAYIKPVKPCDSDRCSFYETCPYLNKDGIRDREKCKGEQYGEDIIEVD